MYLKRNINQRRGYESIVKKIGRDNTSIMRN